MSPVEVQTVQLLKINRQGTLQPVSYKAIYKTLRSIRYPFLHLLSAAVMEKTRSPTSCKSTHS
jgi:hypothetical protein